MFLLSCPHCKDVVKMSLKPKHCECGGVGGALANSNAISIFGSAKVIEISETRLHTCLEISRKTEDNVPLLSSIIPLHDKRIIRLGNKEKS